MDARPDTPHVLAINDERQISSSTPRSSWREGFRVSTELVPLATVGEVLALATVGEVLALATDVVVLDRLPGARTAAPPS
jgi:hypothetical protein